MHRSALAIQAHCTRQTATVATEITELESLMLATFVAVRLGHRNAPGLGFTALLNLHGCMPFCLNLQITGPIFRSNCSHNAPGFGPVDRPMKNFFTNRWRLPVWSPQATIMFFRKLQRSRNDC